MGAIESFLHFDLIHVDHRPHTSPKLLQLLIVEDACSLCVCVHVCAGRRFSSFSGQQEATQLLGSAAELCGSARCDRFSQLCVYERAWYLLGIYQRL